MALSRNPNPKWARVRRAERFFLRWAAQSAPLTDDEAEAITRCRITRAAQDDLRLLMECKGRWQGGPLFALRASGELKVQMARSGMPRHITPTPDPYALDPAYMLGMSDMLDPVQLDWRANWIARPDSLMPEDLTSWADEGLHRGIVDDEHPLIAVGHDRDGMSYWALIRDIEAGEWRDLTIYRP